MPDSNTDDFLNRSLLRELAGEKAYVRGEEYASGGCVRQVQFGPDRVSARVTGSRVYRVKLWRARGELQFSCTCPVGRESGFCKHCVAVGLTWVQGAEQARTGTPPIQPSDAGAEKASQSRETLGRHLRALDRERLVSLLLEATDYDDILRRRLQMEAVGVAKCSGRRGSPAPDFAAYRQIIHDAISTPDYVDYDAMPDYAHGVVEAVQPLGDLLRAGHAREVMELVELALIELDRANEMIDASDGSLNAVYDDLQQLHLEGSRAAGLPPEKLAERLLNFELEGGLGVFNNAAKNYAEILGPAGVAAWRKLLIREWASLPAAPSRSEKGASKPETIDHRRFQIQALMENLAATEGDLETLTAIKQRDLSIPLDYLSLAEVYQGAGRVEEAISWAERGLRVFPNERDRFDLRDFLVEAYSRTGRHDEATALVWQDFAHFQNLEQYRRLKAHAAHVSEGWLVWNARAIALTREGLGSEKTPGRERHWLRAPDHSKLVEFFLTDDAIDEAWVEAQAGGCRQALWLQLADRRAATHPAEALEVYQRLLGPTIAQGGARSYREAIEILTKISTVLEEMGRASEFDVFRAEVRATHRQKRSFVKLLDAAGH